MPDVLAHLRRNARVRTERRQGVDRGERQDDVHDERDRDQRRDGDDEPARDVAAHSSRSSCRSGAGWRGGKAPPRHRRTPGACYLDQSAMFHISESHGVGSTPLRLLATPEVENVRLTSGMITTSLIRRSLAWIARALRLA